MIFDLLDNARLYRGIHPTLDRAIPFLEPVSLTLLSTGRHDLDEGVFAVVNHYTTLPPADTFWEAHNLHADVQIMISGAERIDWTPRRRTHIVEPYDPQRELVKLRPFDDTSPLSLILRPGWFALFLPSDAHRPGMALETPAPVHKVVLKLRLDE